jgi:quercetin dioxygenase-like cupin family protein
VSSKSAALALMFISGVFLGTVTTSTLSAQFRTGKTSQLLKRDLTGCAGMEVTVTINEFQPGTSGPHYHPGDSFTYILEGSEVYQVEREPKRIVNAGDVLHEPPMKIHTVENAAPVKLLVVRVQEKGQTETVRVNPKP